MIDPNDQNAMDEAAEQAAEREAAERAIAKAAKEETRDFRLDPDYVQLVGTDKQLSDLAAAAEEDAEAESSPQVDNTVENPGPVRTPLGVLYPEDAPRAHIWPSIDEIKFENTDGNPERDVDADAAAAEFFESAVDEEQIASASREAGAEPPTTEPDFDPWAVHAEHAPELRTRIAVIGSYDWEVNSAVLEVIQNFWNKIDNAPLTILVSGCPSGPEGVVQTVAPQLGIEVEVIRDEEIVRSGAVAVFAFIRGDSEGATRALGYVRGAGMPVTVYREETLGGNNAWTSR